MFFSASMEGTDGLLRVSLMYEGGYGTLQVYDDRGLTGGAEGGSLARPAFF